ncbi:MAG: RNA polymerase subunit sigma-24 [Pyrinomonadaceae bacterium]|nr:RNA polymerase subunit sigma-24 [Pyrinomonadaceae bacterium]
MLHIHNGDSTANTAKLSALPGEHFAFREALLEGPTPTGLDQAEWRAIRARHLSEAYGVGPEQCERELLEQETKLATFEDQEEIVFWFEHDLFCQLHLLYLLNWYSHHELRKTRLSLVCIDRFPGFADFRGLGQLTAEQLASLFPDRGEIKAPELKLASAAWQAYCSPNPTDIEGLLETDTSALPFLDAAFRAHLRRFPSVENGLGAIENTSLGLVLTGKTAFIDLFQSFGDAAPIYGLGDAQLWLALRKLSEGREPLLLSANGSRLEGKLAAGQAGGLIFEVTEQGRAVLAGKTDSVTLNGIDVWLGGVHLSSPNYLWRWNDESGTLVSVPTQ